mmetsp:Transcript_47451/g.122816  ORF Transcript_47451/g.122816 Transcript_47451/m.122816 type:complete len:124 (-) Transcript_47451:1588-1959(-)
MQLKLQQRQKQSPPHSAVMKSADRFITLLNELEKKDASLVAEVQRSSTFREELKVAEKKIWTLDESLKAINSEVDNVRKQLERKNEETAYLTSKIEEVKRESEEMKSNYERKMRTMTADFFRR